MYKFCLCVLFFSGFVLSVRGDETNFVVKDKVLVKYRGTGADVVIPPKLGINRIGARAFAGSTINSVVIPMGVGYIDERAFMNCSFLKSVTFPNTIIGIGQRAFFNCFILEKINIPRSLVTIDDGAFYNCRSLQEVDIPDTLKSLGSRAFSGCTGIVKLGVSRRTILGEHTFLGVDPKAISYKD